MFDKIKPIIAVALVIVTVALLLFCSSKIDELKKQNMELAQQVHSLSVTYSPMQRDTIRDSIQVISQPVLIMQKSEYKDFADKKLIKELQLKVAQITTQHNHVIATADSILLRGNTYKDKWATFKYIPPDSLIYEVKDSIVTLIARQYKHKFLFFHWGTKGYIVKVINFNPHSKILYNTYINVDK